MSTTVFPFSCVPGPSYDEDIVWIEDVSMSRGGRGAVLSRASAGKFVVRRGVLRLPDSAGNTVDSWRDFKDDRQGRADTFLYRAMYATHREVSGGALGTGDASTVAFAFSDGTDLHKYLENGDYSDAVTLKVFVDGVEQTLTTDYTVSGNGTDPTVTFEAGSTPGGSAAITVSYRYYMPVRFASSQFPTRPLVQKSGHDINTEETVEITVSMEEDRAGARFAT